MLTCKGKKTMKKKLWAILLCVTMLCALLPTAAFAARETVSDARTFVFLGGTTTQAEIDAAWGEGAVAYTSQEVGGEMVYTIKLLKNIQMATGQDVRIGKYQESGPAPVQMILDLNGCMITSSSIGLINYSNLIIRDTSAEKTGGICYSTTSDKSSLVTISHQGGLLVIEDGTFICESGYAFTGYVAAVSTQAGATTHIKGGTFNSNSSAVLSAGETIVYGGSFEATYGMYAKSANGVPGTITIPQDSTAQVTASSFALVIQRDNGTDGQISVSGGSFDAPNVVGGVRQPDTLQAVEIEGGVYSANPSSWVPSDTAVARLSVQGDTSYIVGGNDIAAAASQAGEGDSLEVLSGKVSLDNVAEGVEVSNVGGDVVVNGESVEQGEQLTVCNHEWDAPKWNWNDDFSQAQALFTCQKNAAHTKTLNATVSETVKTPASCTNPGAATRTAKVVADGADFTDEQQVVLAATGHHFENGVCTVCGEKDPNAFTPAIIKGANGTWQTGSEAGLSFTSNAEYQDFLAVKVDGQSLGSASYSVQKGSTVVTLKPSYLKTLSLGKHALDIVSQPGTASTTFTITESDNEVILPQTGDNSNMGLWIVLMCVAGIALGSLFALIKRKERAQNK